MKEWTNIAVAVAVPTLVSLILVVFIWRRCCNKTQRAISDGNRAVTYEPDNGKKKGDYYVFRRRIPEKPRFNWADHPSLVTDAVENGWSRFGFTCSTPPPSAKSGLLGICAAANNGGASGVEIYWEVCPASADFMQKIRLNSGINKKANLNKNSAAVASVIRTVLPLPGPPLGNSAFPQEAYFEITILFCGNDDQEGEMTKLIHENGNAEVNSEMNIGGNGVKMSLGLTGGGSLPPKLPGVYSGSIGFNSDGSVYRDGIKIVFGSEKEEWGKPERVIGCGFDPRQKKVYFTVDSELTHVINCTTEEFGAPMYPVLAANDDVTVLVNFGQSAFVYSPANAHRTANPCFIGLPVNPSALGYEDSKELFSMGRIDSQWLNRNTAKSGLMVSPRNTTAELDKESETEADLFEIVLDNHNSRKSPDSGI